MTLQKAKHLSQVLSVEAGVRKGLEKTKTRLHRSSGKAELYEGFAENYTPKNDDGDPQPARSKIVQQRAEDVVQDLCGSLVDLFDIVATKDISNKNTSAKVQIGDEVFLDDVPVPYLLFMEKQLDDLQKFVESMPTLDLSVEWSYNDERRLHTTESVRKNSTKRDRVNHIKAEATKEHPAQVEVFEEDVLVGYWDAIRYSGAFPENRKQQVLGRILQFKNAVKFAREQANQVSASNTRVGEKILGFIFAD